MPPDRFTVEPLSKADPKGAEVVTFRCSPKLAGTFKGWAAAWAKENGESVSPGRIAREMATLALLGFSCKQYVEMSLLAKIRGGRDAFTQTVLEASEAISNRENDIGRGFRPEELNAYLKYLVRATQKGKAQVASFG